MKKIFIDTNIVIDLLAHREPFYKESAELFSQADQHKIKLSVSALSFANVNYILSKELSSAKARQLLSKIKVLAKVISFTDKIIDLALNDEDFADFEDGLQYYSAIDYKADLIITRNKKDFAASAIPVLTAKEYLASV